MKCLSRLLVNFLKSGCFFLTVNLYLYNKRGQFVELRQIKNKVKMLQLYRLLSPCISFLINFHNSRIVFIVYKVFSQLFNSYKRLGIHIRKMFALTV